MRIQLLPFLFLAPSLTLVAALPSPEPDSPSRPHSLSFVARISTLVNPRAVVKPYRPLNGYEDEDTHNPPPPRRRGFWLNFGSSIGSKNTNANINVHKNALMNKMDYIKAQNRILDSDSQGGGRYPKCQATTKRKKRRSGFAHYPGWKLVGDDLSGALPVSPRADCVNVCNKYGAACSGIFYDDTISRCYLKGTKKDSWSFTETDEDEDGTDLLGGCAAWQGIVPKEMDDVCCRD
ncbi:hypothetical protein IAR55_007129 [Kwoniella newhampshirensis]|uniref:Apple domain-containing protein n=1 Tax=Kwoniella newhampshirensis TaxID=1651941 RepID=A0AAW0YSI6_9TREE